MRAMRSEQICDIKTDVMYLSYFVVPLAPKKVLAASAAIYIYHFSSPPIKSSGSMV